MVSHNQPSLRKHAESIAASLLEITGEQPKLAMLLGTGHTSIAGQLKNKHTFGPDDVPGGLHFAKKAPLLFGHLEGVPVIVGDAPVAAYEGHSVDELALPVRVFRAMGAEALILTAAAASLSLQLEPGTIAIIEDHINLSGINPLQGPNDDMLGPRFPDMSDPYTSSWRQLARDVAKEIGIPCLPGIFAAVPGPSLPTRAEYRFLRRAGADLVGMSLVPEVLVATHAGFKVLALAAVTQLANVDSPEPTSIEDMLDAADVAAPRIAAMLTGISSSLR